MTTYVAWSAFIALVAILAGPATAITDNDFYKQIADAWKVSEFQAIKMMKEMNIDSVGQEKLLTEMSTLSNYDRALLAAKPEKMRTFFMSNTEISSKEFDTIMTIHVVAALEKAGVVAGNLTTEDSDETGSLTDPEDKSEETSTETEDGLTEEEVEGYKKYVTEYTTVNKKDPEAYKSNTIRYEMSFYILVTLLIPQAVFMF